MIFSRLQLLFGLALLLQFSLGEVLASPKESRTSLGKLSLSVKTSSVEELNELVLILSFPQNVTPKVFPLSNPERLVIDLPGISIKRNQGFTLPEHSSIKEIRAGVHPDRLRMVLDFAQGGVNSSARYSEELESTRLKLTFPTDAGTSLEPVSFSASFKVRELPSLKVAKPSSKPTQEIASAKAIEPQTKVKIEKEAQDYTPSKKPLILGATKIKEVDSSIEQSSLKQELIPKAIASSTSNILSAIRFDSATRTVRFEIKDLAPYTLTKRDSETYLLKLDQISPKHEGLTLPFFPPGELLGLDSVVAKQINQSLEIALNIENGAAVSAFSSNSDGINAVVVRIEAK